MKQRIDIGIRTSSASESFRILKVLLVTEKTASEVPQVTEVTNVTGTVTEAKETVTEVPLEDKETVTDAKGTPEVSPKYLIVISKRSDPTGWCGVATMGKFDIFVEVDVDEIIPVHHYVIGLDMLRSDIAISELNEASQNFGPNVPHRKLRSSKDLVIPQNASAEVLYENPETEEVEEEIFKNFWEAENKYFAAEKEKMDSLSATSSSSSSSSSSSASNASKVVNPIRPIRPSSPGVADSSACVGCRTDYDYDYELPLSVKIMAFTTVGILGMLFFRFIRN